jgi:multiple sugar transport system permease protein
MIAPAVLIIVFLIGYPFVYSILLSLTNTSVGRAGSFVGLSNFAKLLKNTVFRRVLLNSGIFTVGAVGAKLIIGLGVALLIEKFSRGSKFIRGSVLLPWVVPTSLSALAWWWMFNPNFSVLNWVITRAIKLSSGIPWLSDARAAMLSVIIVHVWRGVPFFAISLLAGLVSINREYYEVADSEGAKKWQKFLYITLPLLRPVIAVVLLFSTLMTISEFNIIYIITGGGPRYSTHLLATLAYQEGIATGTLSRGAAISLFLFPILFVASYLQIRVVRENVRKF